MKPRRQKLKLIVIKKLLPIICGLLIVIPAMVFCLQKRQDNQAGWTVMVYMVGTDLETNHGLAEKDLQEMVSCVRDDTTLLVMAGGAQTWTNDFDPEAVTIYQVQQGSIAPVSFYSDISMGDPKTLEILLQTGLEKAGGSTALILWDHGYGAMEGFGKDDNYSDSRLTLSELMAALEECKINERKLTLLGFDACFMAGCETALVAAPYADYMVASQETEPPEGWNYSFLSELKPTAKGAIIGKEIVASYNAYYRNQYALYKSLEQPYTLSLIDLNNIEVLGSSITSFLEETHNQLKNGSFSIISRIRGQSWMYGRSTTTTEYDLVDLEALSRYCKGTNPYAENVISALEKSVLDSKGNVSEASGLSIYFPQFAITSHRNRWRSELELLPLSHQWKDFIAAYEEALDSHIAQQILNEGELPYSVVLSDELLQNFARAKYYVLRGSDSEEMQLLYASNNYLLQDHILSVPYEKQYLVLHMPQGDFPLPAFYIQEDDRTAYYQNNIITVANDSTPKTVRMRIEHNKENDNWQVLSAFDISDEFVTGRQEINLEEQKELWIVSYFYEPAYSTTGQLLPFTQWAGTLFPDIELCDFAGDYSLSEAEISPDDHGQYWLQIVVVDTHNQEYASALFPVK